MDKNATIGFFGHKPSGCMWYRIKQPMDMLERNGIKTVEVHLNEDVDDGFKSFQFYGATPFSMESVFKYMKENGKKIVYDMDDALDLVEVSNPFYYSVKKDKASQLLALQYADEVTVSTPKFIDYLKDKTKAKVTVIPNCYTPSEWMYPRPQREGIRIGYCGSSTHVQDLIDIIPIIGRLQKKYDVKFLIMGFGHADYQTWYKDFRYSAPEEANALLQELDKRLSTISFEWIPFVDYTMYPSTLINMSLDIGLCPLKDTPFNQHRSACKAMEYTLSGALALASDSISYREDQSSVLVKDNEWEEVIEYFIVHPDRRKATLDEHLEWVKVNRMIDTQLEPLKKIYL
jgi:hypothetical protein